MRQSLLLFCGKGKWKGESMDIIYYGHSAFKLKGKMGTVVTDPYEDYVGFSLPNLSADIVTVSHQHPDHQASSKIKATSRRDKSFLIDQIGEYEVGGISVFGTKTYHDDSQGSQRGGNIVFTVMIDGVKICHLGDLGHELSSDQINEIGAVDIVLCPVGGVFTIDPSEAVKIIRALEPGIIIPMHYKTALHDQKVFGEMKNLEDFLKVYGAEVKPQEKLTVDKTRIPEETELVVLEFQA